MKMNKVMITSRSFGSVSDDPFQALERGNLVHTMVGKGFDQEAFEKNILEYDALIIGAHPFPKEVMEKCKNLKIIAKHGAGLDNIDLEAARALGIKVTNAPALNANAVADLAFGHILNVARGITVCNNLVKKGQWKTYIGVDVFSKTLGILGFGAVAKNVARRAKGFSMKVLAYDPYISEVPEEFKEYVELTDLDSVIRKSDFLTIHMPLTEDTRNFLNYERLSLMKEEAFLINTGRGGIVNEEDLYRVLTEKKIKGAALDVTEVEPIRKGHPLLTLENVIITPHIGMYSKEAINAVSLTCAENVAHYFLGEKMNFEVV